MSEQNNSGFPFTEVSDGGFDIDAIFGDAASAGAAGGVNPFEAALAQQAAAAEPKPQEQPQPVEQSPARQAAPQPAPEQTAQAVPESQTQAAQTAQKPLPAPVPEVKASAVPVPQPGLDIDPLTAAIAEQEVKAEQKAAKSLFEKAPVFAYGSAKEEIVYAKTNPEKGAKGISCFLVDMSLPGVSCGKHEEKMGQRGVPVSDVVLEDVRVPKDCLIGELDLGFINAMKTLSVGRVGVASMCLGMAAEAVELAVEHTKNRVQFGKPLCKHQAIAFMLADMETKLNAARGLVYNAAWMMDNGEKADKAASMAKYYAAEAAIDIINKSLQLHGGYGYSREYEIERLYRDIRVCAIYEGSSQVQQIVISGQMLK